MKTKQQAIQEAYGEHWETFNETSKECAFKHDGFIASVLEHRLQDIETEYSEKKRAWRPKSLQGIENNNGWIRIESEDDLPKDSSVNYFGYCYHFNSEDIYTINELISYYKSKEITHYQRIEKPKPPIY